MKIITIVLSFTFFLVSCGGNTSRNSEVTSEITQTKISKSVCETMAQKAGENLTNSNENPDVNLEFLGNVEAQGTCYLKVKITQTVGVEQAEVFTLFDTKTEQSFKNYIDEQQMELAIIEMNQ